MGEKRGTIYTASMKEREAACNLAYEERVKAALAFTAGVSLPQDRPRLRGILNLIKAYKGEYDNPVPDYPLRAAYRRSLFEALAHFGEDNA